MLQTMWYEFDLDQRFTMGDQDLWGLIFPGVSTYRRKTFNYNLTNGIIQTPSGYQRRNRKTSTCIPILSTAQKTADQLTKCLFHVINKSGVYQTYSDCFEKGALTQGLGFLYTYIDKTEDDIISGNIKKKYIDPKATWFDPYGRKHDMSDWRYWSFRQFFDKEQAAVQYSEYYDEIMSLPNGTYRDDKLYYMPEVYQIQFPNLVAVDEYWYLTNRKATYLIDKKTEECQEWTGDEEQLRDVMRQFKGQFAVQEKRKPTVRRTLIVNDKDLVDEEDPNGIDRYPVAACLGYFNPDSPYYAYKFRGIARDIRDAQYTFNRFQVNGMDQVESQQQGIKMEKGALVTPDDSLNAGNGRVLTTATGMFDKVEKLHIDPPSPVFLQMVDVLKNYMMEIAGVTPEMMGQEIDDKAGIITMIRQSASITRLQTLFDQFDEFQRIDGDITIQMIQSHFTYGKVEQIIGEEPTPEFSNKLFFKYGCKVVPGVLTETQGQLEAQQLMYAKTELGIPISSKRILKSMTLQDKDEIIKEVEQMEQAQAQQAQQMAQLQMKQLEVENATKLSYAHSQESLGNERMAKIKTDMAVAEDKLKRAHQEDTQSLLNFIKAIKELKGMDIQHIADQITILKEIEQGRADAEPKETDAVA